jgi:hypothetical protein
MRDVPHLVSPSSGGFGSPTRPFWTGGAVGPGKTILAVCFGDVLQTFNIETRKPLRSQILPFAVFQFSVADFDPAVVALASLNRIGVFSVSPDGFFEQQHMIDLGAVSSSNALLRIEWVADCVYQLAVVSLMAVHIFEFLINPTTPLVTFIPSKPINSCVFFTIDNVQYFVMVEDSGRIGIDQYMEGLMATKSITRYIDCPPVAHISYSPETNILFLSASRELGSLLLCRPIDLITHGTGPLTKCTIVQVGGFGYSPSPEEFHFSAVHPTIPSMHFFRTVPPGRCAVLEFLDSGVSFQLISCPWIHGDEVVFFQFKDSIAGISCGRLFQLAAGRWLGDLSCEFTEPEFKSESIEETTSFSVPPTFWSKSLSTSDGIEVTDDEGNVCTEILHQSAQLFSRRSLTLTIQSHSRVIVGVQIDFGSPIPSAVRILNRRYVLPDQPRKRFQFPLKPEETLHRNEIRIRIETQADQVPIEGIRVHTNPGNTGEQRLLDGEIIDLQDFVDPAIGKYRDQLDLMLGFLSGLKFDENAEIDREAGVLLLKLMCTQPRIEVTCRRAILRAFREKSCLMEIWAEAIKQVCEESAVHEELKSMLWRDFSCLEPKYQAKVGISIWKLVPNGVPGYALVSALVSLEKFGNP